MAATAHLARVCFTLRVRAEMLDEYLRLHNPVRADMLAEIAASGRSNYALFVRRDGLLIGYYETRDDTAAQAYLAASDVATRWEADMAPFFVGLEGRPDQVPPLVEIFHLESQIADASPALNNEASTPKEAKTHDPHP